jgi:acyl-CoA dehydrogenase
VAAIKTTARDAGDHYLVNGSKTFISGGMRASAFTTAVRAVAAPR